MPHTPLRELLERSSLRTRKNFHPRADSATQNPRGDEKFFGIIRSFFQKAPE